MNLTLQRQERTKYSTIGELTVIGNHFCWILEPANPIPAGTYTLYYRWSNKNEMQVLGLLHVPGYEDIEIHIGNFPADTEGCLIPGFTKQEDFVGQSEKAFKALMTRLPVDEPKTLTILDIGEERKPT
jgi:hypothetical protein